MENASKAFIIAGALLISVMILGMMMYLFGNAARVPAAYEDAKFQEMNAAFNAKFEGYGKVADYDNNGIIDDNGKTKKANQYGDMVFFYEDSEIFNVSNTFSEVISACNAAYDTNTKNENDKNNSVTIDIKMEGHFDTDYCIVPAKDGDGNNILKKGYVFEGSSDSVNPDTAEQVELFSLLREEVSISGKTYTLSDTKYFSNENIQGMKYKFYFDGLLEYGDNDQFKNFGKITKVTFTLKVNSLYDV